MIYIVIIQTKYKYSISCVSRVSENIGALQYCFKFHSTSLKGNEIKTNQNMISLRRTSYIVLFSILCLIELDVIQLKFILTYE